MKKANRIRTSKYNKYSFFFINMYHQLSKPSNLFFLLTMILLTIPQISPFNPYTYLLAFLIVTGTSMVKDGIEDYNRHKEDEKINLKPVNIAYVNDDVIINKEIFVEDLQVNNFVVLKANEEVPGDCVLLLSKVKGSCAGHCFVDTSNLDGESNLKKKSSVTPVKCKNQKTASSSDSLLHEFCKCELEMLKNILHSETKDTGDLLNKFECEITDLNQSILCTERNVLLKGMKIKNVESVLAFVIAVGKDTKLGKSNVMSRNMNSLFEAELTKVIMIIFFVYFVLLLSTSVLGSLFLTKSNLSYLYLNRYLTSEALKLTGTNYILFSYLIPLSLFVTLEVSRMFHSAYISHDEKMTKNGIHSVCRNSSVTEDLGMIEYILSDKTGTLTKNKMVFKKLHLHENSYIEDVSKLRINCSDLEEIKRALEQNNLSDELFQKIMFIFVLLCNNSVEPLNGNLEGISQDEICILKQLTRIDVQLHRREDKYVIIKINDLSIKCNIKYTLDFTSYRQRMSVIIEVFGMLFLFSKGSDQKMLNEGKVVFGKSSKESLCRLINTNSSYRTLITAYKKLSRDEFAILKNKFDKISLENREEKENKLFESLETNMKYLGTTFIEDELQDEVKETINMLKLANIKIWMITGDKKETAISCAIDSGIMSNENDREVIAIEGKDFDEAISNINILSYKSVIFYRSTPKQKSQIATKLKIYKKNTLAVGDGNNDVPMLLTANIGVGILGKEGNQAGISADFAVPDFQSLRYLILIHGRYNFIRFSKVTLNALYKNIYLIIIQYLYNFFSGFSGKPIYNNYFLNYYNVFFTSLIPASICCFDKDLTESYLLRNPKEYVDTRGFFCKPTILLGLIYGIMQGVIVFILVFGSTYVKDLMNFRGRVAGYNGLNNLTSLIVFFSVMLSQINLISFYTIYSYIAIGLSFFLFFITLFVVQDTSLDGNIWILMSIPSAYFTFIFVILASYIYEICLRKMFYRVIDSKH